MTDIMLDIETLGICPNSVILTIGAIKFNIKDEIKEIKQLKDTKDCFYVRINFKSCINLEMEINEDTVNWWEEQSKEAQYEVFKHKDRVDIKEGLTKLSDFLKNSNTIWANSPSFDCVILENAYKLCKLEIPWKFWNLRDTRTVYALGNIKLKDYSSKTESHNSLYDCYNQIRALKQSFKNLKLI